MVVMNNNTSDSLVNGSLGTILDVVTDTEGKVKYVIVKFDLEKSGAEQRRIHSQISEKYKGIPKKY